VQGYAVAGELNLWLVGCGRACASYSRDSPEVLPESLVLSRFTARQKSLEVRCPLPRGYQPQNHFPPHIHPISPQLPMAAARTLRIGITPLLLPN
jgi:hypothetical protein